MRSKRLLILAILLLSIGFASISTFLYLNGSTTIGFNFEDYDIYFSKSILDNNDISSESISTDGKRINYTVTELKGIGNRSELVYEITNNSSMYDAIVNVECENEENEYYRIIKDGEKIIRAKSKENGKLIIEQIKSTTEERTFTFECIINASAQGKEEIVEEENTENTYSFYGYLTDDEGNVLANKTMVMYSSPKYITTDDRGYFYVDGIESGTHELYYLGDKTKSELESLSKDKIKEEAITKINLTTSSKSVKFENNYKVRDTVIELVNHRDINITLDLNEGELESNDIDLNQNNKYGSLPIPTREGYNFQGWYIGDYKVKENDLVIDNTRLSARWEPKTFTITFDSAGGPSVTTVETVTYDSAYGFTMPEISRTGYKFLGWYINTTKIEETSIIKILSNTTLVAKWEANTFTVTYNANGGSGTTAVTTCTYDQACTLKNSSFTKTGYSFSKWAKDSTSGTQYAVSASCKNWATSGNINVYAIWNVNSYTVTFNPNGGSVSTTSKSVTYGGTYGTLPTPTKSGYTFDGWLNTVYPYGLFRSSDGWIDNQKVITTKDLNYVKVVFNQNTSTPGYINYAANNNYTKIGEKYKVYLTMKGINITQLHLGVYGDTCVFNNINSESFQTYMCDITAQGVRIDNYVLLYGVGPTIGTGFQIKSMQILPADQAGDLNINSSSVVKNAGNHVLYASWLKNVSFSYSNLATDANWAANQNVVVSKGSDYTQVLFNQTTSTPGYILKKTNTFFEDGKVYRAYADVKGIGIDYLSLYLYSSVCNFGNLSTTSFKTVSCDFKFTYNSNYEYILLYRSVPTLNTGFQIKNLKFVELY